MRRTLHLLIGFVTAVVVNQPRHDERGLSQSTENAVLLAGAVTVALAVTTAVLAYVKAHLPK